MPKVEIHRDLPWVWIELANGRQYYFREEEAEEFLEEMEDGARAFNLPLEEFILQSAQAWDNAGECHD